MATFITDPTTGRKVLATRRRRGGGCHGARHLQWKSRGSGFQELVCKLCGRVHGERLACFRCGSFKEEVPCEWCAYLAEERVEGSASQAMEEDVPLACKGTAGLCCTCAGIDAVSLED